MHRSILDLAFRFAGGYAIPQLLLPSTGFLQRGGGGTAASAQDSDTPVVEVQGPMLIGKLFVRSPAGGNGAARWRRRKPTSLQKDLELLVQQYALLSVGAMALLVMGGGLAALCGAGTSVYFSGSDGIARYVAVRRWLQERR